MLMTPSSSTVSLLAALDTASRGQLKRRDDLGILLDLGASPDQSAALDNLAFRSKFLTRTFGIMQRIGREGNGYDRLESEFTANMEVARGHLRSLLSGAPDTVRDRFSSSYLALTPGGFSNLMALLGDLAWYKNWLLDSKQARA
jgi:hypothetical protein